MESFTRPPVCGSPLRQLSPSEKQTLRSRIIKETPQRFYSNQSLFNTNQEHLHSQQQQQQQQQQQHNSFVNDEEIVEVAPTSDKTATNANTRTSSRAPGFSENPILAKFINTSINKEHEFHKLIINIVSLFTITLLIKFIKLIYQIYNNYQFGQQSLLEKIIPCDDTDGLQSFASTTATTEFCHSYSFFGWNNWQFYIINIVKFIITIMNNIDNIKKIINFIITFNIIVSSGKLISYSRRSISQEENNNGSNNLIISDKDSNQMGLSSKQKDLLGLDDDLSFKRIDGNSKEKNQHNNSKPHQIILNDQLHGDSNNHMMKMKPLSTPYLFKSLQTPLKRDQEALEKARLQQQQQQPFRMAVPSTMSRGYKNTQNNIFNNNNNNTSVPVLLNNNNNNSTNNNTISNVRNMGYIPSNKYAYMMNSPSPMKKR